MSAEEQVATQARIRAQIVADVHGWFSSTRSALQDAEFEQTGPFTTQQDELLGAVSQLRLSRPVTVAVAWPAMEYDRTEATNAPYQTPVLALGVRDMVTVLIFTDRSGEIISVLPGLEAGVRYPKGYIKEGYNDELG